MRAAADYAALEGCSSSDRLCLAYPDNCVANNNCELMATVRRDPAGSTKYRFEMAAQFHGYVAVALAESDLMGVDSVVECVVDPADSKVRLFQSMNKALNLTTGKRGNARLPAEEQTGVSLLEGTAQNGVVSCSFLRDPVTTVGGKTYDLASGTWYLQAAAGDRINADTSIHHHLEWVTSGSAVKLSASGLVADSHGSRRSAPAPSSAVLMPSSPAPFLALAAVALALRAL